MEILFTNLKEEWFWAMMQCFIVGLTLILIYFQVRIQTTTHFITTLTAIDHRWNSESMLLARHRACSDWLDNKREFDGVARYVAEFMEELSIYSEMNAVPDKTMWDVQSWNVEHYYCLFKNNIIEVREYGRDDSLYTGFQHLYERMNIVSKKMKIDVFERTDDELKYFAEKEVLLTKSILQLQDSIHVR